MAKATRRTTRRGGQSASKGGAPADPRDRIIEALMTLLADRPFGRIGLTEVAREAGVSLAMLREHFDGKIAILAAFSRRIDLAVLSEGAAEGASGPRDRLFEAMMRRLDALGPYRPALRNLARSARSDPLLACALHAIATRAQRWTLVAAGIHHGGIRGRIAVEGAVLAFAEVLKVWLDDEDEDQARTMAALDRALRRGERGMQLLDEVCSVACRFVESGRQMRRGAGSRRGASGEVEA